MAVGDFFLAVHAFDVRGNGIHRPGAIKRHHGDNVVQLGGFHLHQKTGHAHAFQLEHTGSEAFTQEFIGFGVIHRNIIERIAHIMALENQIAGLLHHGQSGKAQEIHFEHAQMIQDGHFILGD